MDAPFRDAMSAAVERTARLAQENEDLREELQRLRRSALEAKVTASDEDKERLDVVEKETLALLDRLASTDRSAASTGGEPLATEKWDSGPPPPAAAPLPSMDLTVATRSDRVMPVANDRLLLDAIHPVPNQARWSSRAVFWFSALAFGAGAWLDHCVRG